MGRIIFLLFFSIAAGALASQLARVLYGQQKTVPACVKSEPFVVSEYFGRMEQELERILTKQEPVDPIIVLWWGLDGLTLDENGELKWISRKKSEPEVAPISPTVFNAALYYPQLNMCQNTEATIHALQCQNAYYKMQAAHQAQCSYLIAHLQSCCAKPQNRGI